MFRESCRFTGSLTMGRASLSCASAHESSGGAVVHAAHAARVDAPLRCRVKRCEASATDEGVSVTAGIVPRWEWRTFGEDFGAAESAFGSLAVERTEESDELYVLAAGATPRSRSAAGASTSSPCRPSTTTGSSSGCRSRSARSRVPRRCRRLARRTAAPPARRSTSRPTSSTSSPTRSCGERPLLAVGVHKRRAHYTVGGCMAELSELRTDAGLDALDRDRVAEPARCWRRCASSAWPRA